MRQRAKPESLYGLVRMLSNSQMEKLLWLELSYAKKGNSPKLSKRWKLIRYYHDLELWNRDEEKRTWGNRLDALKARTTKWLLNSLIIIDEIPNSNLSKTLSTIRALYYFGEYTTIFEYIAEAKHLATISENLECLLEILQFERECLRHSEFAKEKVQFAKNNQSEMESTIEKLNELHQLEAIRMDFVYPLEEDHINGKGINPSILEELSGRVSALEIEAVTTVRGKYELLYLNYFCNVHQGEIEAACSALETILELYDNNSWLADRGLQLYFKDVQRTYRLTAALGNLGKANAILKRLESAYNRDERQRGLVAEGYFKALLWGAYMLKNDGWSDKAVEVYQSNKQFLERSLNPLERYNVLFLISRSYMFVGDFYQAKSYLDELARLKRGVRTTHVAHSRIMYLVCSIVTIGEEDVIHAEAENIAKFLRRQKQAGGFLSLLVKKLGETPDWHLDRKTTIRHLEEVKAMCEIEKEKGSGSSEPEFVDYPKLMDQVLQYFKTSRQGL